MSVDLFGAKVDRRGLFGRRGRALWNAGYEPGDLFKPGIAAGQHELLFDMPGMGHVGPAVDLFMGRRGHGKTAMMVALLARMLQLYKRNGYPGHLFTNLGVTFARRAENGLPIDYAHPDIMRTVQDFPNWFRSGDLAVDEIQGYASGRRSMSASNVNLSSFMVQIRHRDIGAMFTTQFPQVLDYQLLLQVDRFIDVSIVKRWPSRRADLLGSPKVVKLAIHDYWGQWTGRNWRKPWPPRADDADDIRPLFVDEAVGRMYDTKQLLASAYWDEFVRERLEAEESERMGEGFSTGEAWKAALTPEIEKAQVELSHDPGIRYESEADYLARLPEKFNPKQRLAEVESVTNGAVSTQQHLEEWLTSNGFDVRKMKNGHTTATRKAATEEQASA